MKTLLRTLLLLIVFLISGITFMLTPTGLRWGIYFASHALPGTLHIQKISGVIVGPITLEDVRYQDSNQTITLKKLHVDWQPLALLKNNLHIDTFTVDQLQIITKNNPIDDKWNAKRIRRLFDTFVTDIQKHYTNLNLLINHVEFNTIAISNSAEDKNTTLIQQLLLHAQIEKKVINIAIQSKLEKPTPIQLSFLMTGEPLHYHIHTRLTGAGSNWELIGDGTPNEITLRTTHAAFLNGTFNINYQIQMPSETTWNGKLAVRDANLSLLNAAWLNKLSLEINSSGNKKEDFTTHTTVFFKTEKGDGHLKIIRDDAWHVVWDIETHALSRWSEGIEGSLYSKGRIEGDLDNPHFTLSAKSQFETGNLKLNNATLLVEGYLADHTIRLSVTAAEQKILLDAKGRYDKEQWTGTLQKLAMSLAKDTHWHLRNPAAISVSSKKAAIDHLCLFSEKAGAICANGQWSPEKILGQLQIHLSHFGWLESFMPTLHIAAGTMEGTINFSGTLKAPTINGELHFIKSKFVFTRLGITLDNLTAKITTKAQMLLLDIQTMSGTTPLHVTGFVDLSKPELTAQGKLKSSNLLFVNTEEYTAYATADITANVHGNTVLLTGNILIPKASIHPNDFQTTVTLPSHDIVYIGETMHPPKPFWILQNDLLVTLGNQVTITASGVSAQLGGAVRITDLHINQPATGTGDIVVKNGSYNMYGQVLKISPESALIFSDSVLNNPTLRIKATKKIQAINNMGISNFTQSELQVGIEVTGTVKAPKFTFFSNRANLSEADILSYILLGYANTSNTPGNTDFLLRALSAVDITGQGLMGKQNIATQVQRGLGLNEMGVESETTVDALGNPLNRQSAFVVGKNLTQKFYVRYSVGILDPVNVFQLRYLLNKNWAVQTDSSTLGNGADVLYTIERN